MCAQANFSRIRPRFSKNAPPKRTNSSARAASFAETETEKLGRERRIELISPSFTATPKLLIGTQRVALVHRRLAEICVRDLPLVVQEAPFQMPPLREVVQHHSVRASDGGVQWLKGLLHDAADALA